MTENLSPDDWSKAIVGGQEPAQVADRVRSKKFMPWVNVILEHTKCGDHVLELGSGTGEMSAVLALEGRNVTLMDFSKKSLDFSAEVFNKLGIDCRRIKHDVTKQFPFGDNIFDCVFSSGLLEHFQFNDQTDILKEASRATRHKVISLVPNASSIPYRLGKWMQERSGQWKWGKEDPVYSLKEIYEWIGIDNVVEYSIEPLHSLNFLPFKELEIFKRIFYSWICSLNHDEAVRLNQGYLLVSIGYKGKFL